MWLLLLEAFMAMMVLIFIVWWTMFSGRKPDVSPHDTSATREHQDPPGSP